MKPRLIRMIVMIVSSLLVFFQAPVASAADCDRGATVAADLFRAADDHARARNCRDKLVRVMHRRRNGEFVVRETRRVKYAGCVVGRNVSGFASAMQTSWNSFVNDNWATIGPRELEFDMVQSGTVVNPTKRTFVSVVPLESDYATVTAALP